MIQELGLRVEVGFHGISRQLGALWAVLHGCGRNDQGTGDGEGRRAGGVRVSPQKVSIPAESRPPVSAGYRAEGAARRASEWSI